MEKNVLNTDLTGKVCVVTGNFITGLDHAACHFADMSHFST